MPIRPVDYQIMVSRAAEVSRITNNETQKENSMQKHISDAMRNKSEKNLKQVYDKGQTYEAIIKKKQEKKEEKHKKRDSSDKEDSSKNNKEKNNGQKEPKKQQKAKTTIDIKI